MEIYTITNLEDPLCHYRGPEFTSQELGKDKDGKPVAIQHTPTIKEWLEILTMHGAAPDLDKSLSRYRTARKIQAANGSVQLTEEEINVIRENAPPRGVAFVAALCDFLDQFRPEA